MSDDPFLTDSGASVFNTSIFSGGQTGGVQVSDPGPGSVSGLPVFGPNGLQGNLTGNYGQVPTENSLTSPSFNLSTPTLAAPPTAGTAPAAAQTVGAGGSVAPASTTGTPLTAASTGSGSLFVRAVIIILGFIFVAVGLSQFRTTQIVINNVKGAVA